MVVTIDVRGRIAVGSMSEPSKEFINVDLPLLNWPMTTRLNLPSLSLCFRLLSSVDLASTASNLFIMFSISWYVLLSTAWLSSKCPTE